MDFGRAFYHLARLYVWTIVIVSTVTVLVVVFPTEELGTAMAGIWFGVAGFGGLVLLTVVMIYFLQPR
ncbi:MAG: hypothetical protein ACOCY6_00050 [Halodesulfurarchaeum sp.]